MKEVKLTRGYSALVDDEDYERINSLKWFVNINGNYVRAARMKNRKIIYMQHEVLQTKDYIDHINRNSLDNRKENLRITDHAANMLNTVRHIDRIGICYNKRASLWVVYLDRPREPRIYLGYRKTKDEALTLLEEGRIQHESNQNRSITAGYAEI